MFKLPDGIPSIRNSSQDWADFAEFHAIKNGTISILNLIKEPLMVSDEIEVSGIEDETDRLIAKVDEISEELRYRIKISNRRYPFISSNSGYSISFEPQTDYEDVLYRFLLLATRIRMTGQSRYFNSIDGALLFEELSAEVALGYFGVNSEADVFGTSKTDNGGFREKLTHLIGRIGEGGLIHDNSGHRPQDENVDVVIWKGFTDKLPSKLIAFGQCKTGTSWRDKLSELNTEAFCKTWFSRQPVLTPIRMFFCAQYFPREIWNVRANEAGLVFDRFRILDYLPEAIDDNLYERIKSWCDAASNQYLI